MTTYKGRMVTFNMSWNGTKFSEEAINDILSKSGDRIPVTFNFSKDPIGVVTKIEKTEDNSLISTVQVDKDGLESLGLYLVPGGTVNLVDIELDSDGNRIIRHFDLNEVSFTIAPADTHITPIKKDLKKGEKHNER